MRIIKLVIRRVLTVVFGVPLWLLYVLVTGTQRMEYYEARRVGCRVKMDRHLNYTDVTYYTRQTPQPRGYISTREFFSGLWSGPTNPPAPQGKE